MRRILCALAAGLAMGMAGQGIAADSPEAAVKYRQSVMKAIGGHMGSIAAVVKGEVSHGPHVANHARGIKDMSLIVPDIFPPNSTYDDYNKTDALPEIWKEPDKFKKAVEAFQKAAASEKDLDEWVNYWVLEPGDHEGYLQRLGADRLHRLRGRAAVDAWQYDLQKLLPAGPGDRPAGPLERMTVAAAHLTSPRAWIIAGGSRRPEI